MTEATLVLAAGCLLQIAETEITADELGWVEDTRLEIAADPACPWVDIPLTHRASLGPHKARTKLGDGSGGRMGEERWEWGAVRLDGSSSVRLHLPEMISGDRAVIEFERRSPPGPLAWRPGAARFWLAEAKGDAAIDATGEVTRHERLERLFTNTADDALAAVVTSPGHTAQEASAALGPPGNVQIDRRLTLIVPKGDPQIRLYPGGGSFTRVETFLTFPGGDRVRGWVIPAPPDQPVQLKVQPEGGARIVGEGASRRVRVEPSEASARVTLVWQQPDAPTFGENNPETGTLEVDAPGGAVAWEGEAWRLVEIHGRPVLPDRRVLLRALENRFRGVALPEPGAPNALRGRDPGWELAADLRSTLLDRMAVGTWPADPLWPRKLQRARKSMAVTPGEASLILWLYAGQMRMRADWALVRPASNGTAPVHTPSGYTSPLVRIAHEDRTEWIHPTCTVCAPFELHPDLQGAAILGADERTPGPTPGRHLVKVREGEVEWQLEGAPALLLRLWLLGLPPSERTKALAQRVAGPEGTITHLDGIEVAGTPIRVVASRGGGLYTDPLRLPGPGPDDSVWLEWIGERRIEWPDHDIPALDLEAGPLHYSRVRVGGRVVETLIVHERRVEAAAARAVSTARWSAPG